MLPWKVFKTILTGVDWRLECYWFSFPLFRFCCPTDWTMSTASSTLPSQCPSCCPLPHSSVSPLAQKGEITVSILRGIQSVMRNSCATVMEENYCTMIMMGKLLQCWWETVCTSTVPSRSTSCLCGHGGLGIHKDRGSCGNTIIAGAFFIFFSVNSRLGSRLSCGGGGVYGVDVSAHWCCLFFLCGQGGLGSAKTFFLCVCVCELIRQRNDH